MQDETVHKLLNDLPEQWSHVKKLSVSIKDQVAPLQAKEVDILQQKCNKFEMKNGLPKMRETTPRRLSAAKNF